MGSFNSIVFPKPRTSSYNLNHTDLIFIPRPCEKEESVLERSGLPIAQNIVVESHEYNKSVLKTLSPERPGGGMQVVEENWEKGGDEDSGSPESVGFKSLEGT